VPSKPSQRAPPHPADGGVGGVLVGGGEIGGGEIGGGELGGGEIGGGELGGGDVGGGAPLQATPLRAKEVGAGLLPEYVAWKPKLADAPVPSVAL
jgi:hypothetical protein